MPYSRWYCSVCKREFQLQEDAIKHENAHLSCVSIEKEDYGDKTWCYSYPRTITVKMSDGRMLDYAGMTHE